MPQNDLMSEMEKETEGADIGTSISSSEIDAGSRQKDGASGKADEDNGPIILSDNGNSNILDNEEEEEEEKEEEMEEEMEEEKEKERREEKYGDLKGMISTPS